MPIIITRLSDESVVARDTAAWFVGRACDIVPEAAINENYFEKLLVAMVQGLQVSFSMKKTLDKATFRINLESLKIFVGLLHLYLMLPMIMLLV